MKIAIIQTKPRKGDRDANVRDLSQNAETMSRIWRRFLRDAGRAASDVSPVRFEPR